MARPRRPDGIWVDTGGFFAASVPTDRHHAEAKHLHRLAMESRVPLLCSKWTVVETHSLLVARAGRESALRWLQGLGVLVVPVTPDDEDRSLEILRSHEDKDFTLVDASSFAIMERLGIRHYHSYDRRFRQYGKFAAVAPSMF